MALLDTTVLIDLSRGFRSLANARAVAAVDAIRLSGQALFTSRINEAEFLLGIELSNDPVGERARVNLVLSNVLILEVSDQASRRFATVQAGLRRQGISVGDFDVLIAAIALVNGQIILTRNPRDFQDIPGLVVKSY